MSWYHDQVSALIELYKQRPCLYQVKSANYKNKHMRISAYESIEKELRNFRPGTSVPEIKSKINGLRTNFLSKHRKYIKSQKSGCGSDSIYTPSLWYYSDLIFILEYATPRQTIDSLGSLLEDTPSQSSSISVLSEEDATEEQSHIMEYNIDEDVHIYELDEAENITITYEDDESAQGAMETPKKMDVHVPGSSKKRKRTEEDPILSAASNAMNSIVTALQQKKQAGRADDTQVFGDFVVSRLRKLSDEARNNAEEKITHILFEAYRQDKNYK